MNKQTELAIGRIFRILSRPYQDGDLPDYERCRAIILDEAEEQGLDSKPVSIGQHKPGWNRGVLE